MLLREPLLALFVCTALAATGCSSESGSRDASAPEDGESVDLAKDSQAPDQQPDRQEDGLPDTSDLSQPDTLDDSQQDDTATSDSSACGTIPEIGCCEDKVLHWCENDEVKTLDCAPENCGWDTLTLEYLCGSAGPEPSFTYPRECPK